MWRMLALGVWVTGCATAHRGDRTPPPPDRPTLPEDVSPAAWNNSLKELLPALTDCKNQQPGVTGRIEVQIDVGKRGAAREVLAFGGVPSPLRECVASVFRTGHYPPSSKGAYRYVYPINYR
jgi:hypothetical protein